jgi:putative restriction endonuclease
LEAAHIKPFSKYGPNLTLNGLLMRSDLHRLFDLGYFSVTPERCIEVSRRIKEEFENGRDYYALHGKKLIVIPSAPNDQPSAQLLQWHNENVYLG